MGGAGRDLKGIEPDLPCPVQKDKVALIAGDQHPPALGSIEKVLLVAQSMTTEREGSLRRMPEACQPGDDAARDVMIEEEVWHAGLKARRGSVELDQTPGLEQLTVPPVVCQGSMNRFI